MQETCSVPRVKTRLQTSSLRWSCASGLAAGRRPGPSAQRHLRIQSRIVIAIGTADARDGKQVRLHAPPRAVRKGRLKFVLKGQKLKGAWALVRIRPKNWLLIKQRDELASDEDIEKEAPESVATRRTLAQIASDEGGDVAKAATADAPSMRYRRRRGRRPKEVRSDLKDVTPGRRRRLPARPPPRHEPAGRTRQDDERTGAPPRVAIYPGVPRGSRRGVPTVTA
jgi:hypothetical protein